MSSFASESSSDDKDCDAFRNNKKNDAKGRPDLRDHVNIMRSVINSLESSLANGHQTEHHILLTLEIKNVKNQKLNDQLEEARKENKQLLNVMQQRCCGSRSLAISPLSSVSFVHLQYKYEELLESHLRLLKVLETRIRQVQNCHSEQETLRDELNSLQFKISDHNHHMRKICNKYVALRKRKNAKIFRLRSDLESLKMIHKRLVESIHHEHTIRETLLKEILETSRDPYRSLLLQEASVLQMKYVCIHITNMNTCRFEEETPYNTRILC